MKTSNRYKVRPEKIHSLEDLNLEKKRLRFEIMKTEENIHTGYRHILEALTFKNIASTIVQDFSSTSTVVQKLFSFGKSVMAKRKKKKHDKMKTADDDSGS